MTQLSNHRTTRNVKRNHNITLIRQRNTNQNASNRVLNVTLNVNSTIDHRTTTNSRGDRSLRQDQLPKPVNLSARSTVRRVGGLLYQWTSSLATCSTGRREIRFSISMTTILARRPILTRTLNFFRTTTRATRRHPIRQAVKMTSFKRAIHVLGLFATFLPKRRVG